ncbi:hypothetical protein LJ655_09755 [Paraburkholderia sp. MMS20-SJTN17]|uniref:Uncharacterized protein n=1 Tax=Paraburkholderia translucens TaxID=2886945 RepID=A0ABS8KCH0_9BURK|nr:hypothetical protein [Paraburkholderia sp. MMS20-SJTN17]MCC8402173.1 hypothetical protein [Paraburkholderia sp. MMS20-SJTN17]
MPLAEVLGAYQKLIEAGKVAVIGASDYCRARVGQALAVWRVHGLPGYRLLQPEYNLYDLSHCERDSGLVVLANHHCFASGFRPS